MIIFPAIDIKGGKCVRLLKGDFNKVTQYEKLPAEQAEIIFNLGFKNILNKSNLKIQYGGGVRSLQDVDDLLNLGVDKVIVGTIAIENMEFLKDACKRYKDKIVVALDVRNGFIASSGWKKQTRILASEFVKKIEFFKISRIIYTDINKDRTKTGPNIKDTSNFSKLTKIPVVVSGGISSINDIKSIKENFPNLYGVIVGKAIYDGTIDIRKLSTI